MNRVTPLNLNTAPRPALVAAKRVSPANTAKFGGEYSDLNKAVAKVIIPVGLAGLAAAVAGVFGLGYYVGSRNSEAPKQDVPQVQTDNTKPAASPVSQ